MITFKKRVLLLLTCVLIVANLMAQHNLQDKLPLDAQVKVGKLANGLTYYIRKNSKPENKVELRLAVNAGSILEDDDQQGLAHFTEHMAFNGTKNFKKNDLVSFLQSIGVEFGADLNAYTGFDETVYILPIPTDKKENIEKGFQILEDWASTITFSNTEIDKERGVVLEELRLGKGAEDRMFRVVYPKMFAGSRYADRLPIGKEDILKNFKYDAIKRFYKDWYRPDLMAVAVVGDVDVAEMERLVKSHFEKLKQPASPRPRQLADVPVRTKSEGIVVTDKEATNHVVEIHYSYKKAKEEITIGDYRDHLIRNLVTSMLSQRMQELTQSAEPPFIFGGTFIGGYARGFEAVQSVGYVSKAGVETALSALIEENERMRKFGFTPGELERTKKNMMKRMERAFNERDKTESADLIEEYIRHFLEHEPIPGIENEFSYYKQYLEGISLEEVNRFAAALMPAADDHKLVVLTGPDQAEFKIPAHDELLAMADRAAQKVITPYQEKAVAATLMTKLPTAGKIVDEKINKELGFTELVLSNRVKVLVKPTDFKNDQVVMSATRFGGQYLFDAKDRASAEYASTVIAQMGVGDFSPVDLRKVLAGKTASVAPRISTLNETITGQSSATDVETLLQLTHLYFTHPRRDSTLFRSFISKQQDLYQNMVADPQYAFQDSVLSILYQNHPWAPRVPKATTFSQINEQRAFEIYQERFGNANGFTFVLVGSFDLAMIKPMLETYLGSLPSAAVVSNFKDAGLRPVKGVVKKEVKRGTEPKSFIRMFWNGEAPYSDSEQLKVQALTEVLNIKLIETLREELGGIYGGGMGGGLNKFPYNNYSLSLALPCGPENVDKLITATLAEIEKVKKNGVSVEDLNKVKETWKQQYLVNMKDNAFWARQLIQLTENGTDGKSILNYEQRVTALTVKDIQDAARRYLDMKNFVQVVLNPQK